MGNNEIINVGIGFATGRNNFKSVLYSYMYHLDESEMLKDRNIKLHLFVSYDLNYKNTKSQVASTTGNYTGIYDMSGGNFECVMGYTTGAASGSDSSGITSLYPNFFTDSTYTKYWDKYTSTALTNYNNRILGDATGEMGPFGFDNPNPASSWYKSSVIALMSSRPWFLRGSYYGHGVNAGIFAGNANIGDAQWHYGYRIVLNPSK